MKIYRNNASEPGALNGLQTYSGKFTNTDGAGAHNFIVDNIQGAVFFAKGFNSTTVIEPSSGAGTQSGTTKLTFAVPASGVLQYLIYATLGYNDVSSAGADTTVSDQEVY